VRAGADGGNCEATPLRGFSCFSLFLMMLLPQLISLPPLFESPVSDCVGEEITLGRLFELTCYFENRYICLLLPCQRAFPPRISASFSTLESLKNRPLFSPISSACLHSGLRSPQGLSPMPYPFSGPTTACAKLFLNPNSLVFS